MVGQPINTWTIPGNGGPPVTTFTYVNYSLRPFGTQIDAGGSPTQTLMNLCNPDGGCTALTPGSKLPSSGSSPRGVGWALVLLVGILVLQCCIPFVSAALSTPSRQGQIRGTVVVVQGQKEEGKELVTPTLLYTYAPLASTTPQGYIGTSSASSLRRPSWRALVLLTVFMLATLLPFAAAADLDTDPGNKTQKSDFQCIGPGCSGQVSSASPHLPKPSWPFALLAMFFALQALLPFTLASSSSDSDATTNTTQIADTTPHSTPLPPVTHNDTEKDGPYYTCVETHCTSTASPSRPLPAVRLSWKQSLASALVILALLIPYAAGAGTDAET